MILACFSFLFSASGGEHELPPASLVIDADSSREPRIIYPYDAVLCAGRVYIAGGNPWIDVYEAGSWRDPIGRQGEGPGEFEHDPVRVRIEDNRLVVGEMYHKRESIFTLEGIFVEAGAPRARSLFTDENGKAFRFEKLDFPDAIESGFMVRNQADDCFMGTLAGTSVPDHHVSRYFLEPHRNDAVLFIRRNGLVQRYDLACNLLGEWYLDVRAFARDPEKDDLANALIARLRVKYPERTYKTAYRYGVPIVSTAVHEDHLFALVSNEHNLGRNNKPGEVALFVSEIGTRNTRVFEVTGAPGTVRVSEDHLLIISSEDAFIKLWKIEVLLQ
jgi:hypothetical protein